MALLDRRLNRFCFWIPGSAARPWNDENRVGHRSERRHSEAVRQTTPRHSGAAQRNPESRKDVQRFYAIRLISGIFSCRHSERKGGARPGF